MSLGMLRLSLALRPALPCITATRNCGWVHEWKPGPVPRTEEERIAAAKKYYLIPEDYEVNNEELGFGDYPKLPPVGMDARDPYEDLDYHYWRNNYGETLHTDYECYTADRNDPNEKWSISEGQRWAMMLGYFGFFFCTSFLLDYFDIRTNNPLKPKQYPGPGKVHYTFELEDD